MTATDDSPCKGQEIVEQYRSGDDGFPLRDESDEDLALAFEHWKQEAMVAVDDVTRALLNDSEPLTDEKVEEVMEATDALHALSGTLTLRVPEEHRVEYQDE